ncbi:MAG: DUF2203 domain-containing protein [Planctomycetes bacterium]|nr:DUF2203 domain-containing protein [Planctomycetota bacterium]
MKAKKKNRHYTLDEANAMLPLLRSILRDVTVLANDLRGRYETIVRLQNTPGLDRVQQEEIQRLLEEFETGQDKMREYEIELEKLGVELKDHYTGLIDFRHLRDGKEVFLCWRLGEPEIGHWHELNSGFSGRKKLEETVLNG